MLAPMAATTWQETIGPDEETRFARYGEILVAQQRAQDGAGRALHRKQLLGLRATLTVPDGLPVEARHGLFARPGTHEARIRLSNGAGRVGPDRRPDVRGFAIRVAAEGPGALGGATAAQCFLLINTPTFAFRDVAQFMDVVEASERGQLAVLRAIMKTHGFFGGLARARALGSAFGKPFAGFARETFHSAAPIACGPYAAKVRLVPVDAAATPAPDADDWSRDVTARLASGPLRWDLQLHFFEDEQRTPIEDPTIEWTTSPVTVARLEAPAQDPASPEGRALQDEIERGVFDPWQALIEHRPLGEIMRARKAAYFASQRARGA